MNPVGSGFAGSVPELYERYMVPLMFQVYAVDLAARVGRLKPSRVLEIAAGTGAATRQLARELSAGATIVATDLNQPMLDHAAAISTVRAVAWQRADVMQLPFPDGSFDLVACQFGAMFFPDRPRAYAEVRRVLLPGGRFVFNVWDRLEANEFADTVDRALQACFPDEPPRFMARVPHGYHDRVVIAQDVAQGGFERAAEITTLPARSRAASPRVPAVAICQGTPLRNEIEAHGASCLEEATDCATAAIAARFGSGAVEGRMQAHVVTVER